MKTAKVEAIKTDDDDSLELSCGLSFLKGFLDMLYNTCDADDGLENTDPEGLMVIISEAQLRLKIVHDALDRLKAI